MSEVYCGTDACPIILDSTCVFYKGDDLLYVGVNTNDNLQIVIEKINQAFQNTGIGYAFTNGIVQPTPFDPVQLGGSLIQDTTIGGNHTLTFVGNIQAAKHVTTGGTSNDFVKGDGTLDSTIYQPAGNYLTGLVGDGSVSGPGVGTFILTQVNFAPGTFGSGSIIPIVTVNSKGLVTNVTPTPIIIPPQPLTLVGDVVGSGFTGSTVNLSLQNVNTDVYVNRTLLKFAVNSKGLVTSASPITSSDIISILGYTPASVSNVYTQTQINNFFSGTSPISGYNKSNWDNAYNDKINNVTVSGTTTKTITLTKQNGGTLNATWTESSAIITSVFGRTGDIVAQSGDYDTSQVTENTNLYFTESRVLATLLSGYVSSPGTITATDSILSAIQKLNGNISSLVTGVSSVSGTADRITTSPTSGAVVVDIASTYAGQSSITTLGTITSGNWQGTAIADAYISSASIWNAKQDAISLTTTGNNGSATFISNVLNIPTYTISGLGGVPETRTLTINNISYDLSTDRTWTVGDVRTDQTYSDPTWITSLNWSKITSTPTTLSGYGITDAVPSSRTITINGSAQNLSTDPTFNVGTVTSVAPLTIGAIGTDITSTVVDGTTTPVITLNIPTASATNRGALSSTDWIIFNNKQDQLNGTGFVKATGTTITYDNSTYLTTISGITAGGELSGTYPNPTLVNSAVIGKVLTGLNLTGGGTIASTDSILQAFGKIQNQISAMVGGVIYQGTWNASTNTPTLTSSVGTKGHYYIVTTAGTTNLNGINDWEIGDWVIFNGSTWDKVDNTDAVSSVNGYTGSVSLVTGDVLEGAGSLPGRPSQLYFTEARVRSTPLTGYTVGSNTALAATDNILQAFEKVQGQINNRQPLSTNLTSLAGLTYASTSFVKMTAAGTFALDTNTYLTGNQTITLSGDVTGSGTTAITTTLANSGVVAGTYNNVATQVRPFTVDAKGRITSIGTAITITPAFSSITSTPTTLGGYGITDAYTQTQVNNLLAGYLPLSGGTMTGELIIDTNNDTGLQIKTTAGNQSLWVRAGYDADGTATPVVSLNNIQFQSSGFTSGTFSFVSGNSRRLLIGSTVNSLVPLQENGNQVWHTGNITPVPTSRTLTINGTAFDLSANRSWSVGTVTSVTASSPLSSSGGTTPNITIQQASGSQGGFLSSTDWTTFNNKQNALTNPITGTGTSGQVAYFNGTTTITSESNLFWDATNDRLGIGINNPAYRLDVSSNVAEVMRLRGTNGGGSNNTQLRFFGSHAGTDLWAIGSEVSTGSTDRAFDFYDLVANQNRIRIFSDGNVFIGSSPSNAGFRLDVNGTGRFIRNDAGNISLTNTNLFINQGNLINFIHNTNGSTTNAFIGHGGDSTGNFIIINNSIQALTIARSTGEATFSSTVAATELYLSTSNGLVGNINSTNANGGYITWQTSGTTIADIGTAQQIFGSGGNDTFGINARSARELTFGTNNTERMRITSGGNVGIGTDNPLAKFVVSNGSNENIEFTGGSTIVNGGVIQYINRSGTPTTRPDLNYYLASGGGSHKFYTADTERMRITSGGNVLIGTTSDNGARLRVNGNTYLSADLRFGADFAGSNTAIIKWQGSGAAVPNSLGLFTWADARDIQIGGKDVYFGAEGGATRVRITSGGNVLIGTTSELTGGGRLQVNGDGRFTGDVIAFSSSDARLKDNLTVIDNSLNKINQLSGYSFTWNNKQDTYTGKDYGIIAQEVEALFPEMVTTRDNGMKAVKYDRLIPVLIEAVKELSNKVKVLEGGK